MKYDFDKIVNRRNTNSYKWNMAAAYAENLLMLKVVKAEATYLLWVDVSATGKTGDVFAEGQRERTGVYISGGSQYGKSGENFVRINLACPRSFLEKALNCMKDFI